MGELELSPEAAKLMAARQAAIAELKAIDNKDRGIADGDVVRVSNAHMLIDALTLRTLKGEPVGPTEFKHANEMLDAALEAAGKRSIEIKLEVLHPPLTECPECHHRFDPECIDRHRDDTHGSKPQTSSPIALDAETVGNTAPLDSASAPSLQPSKPACLFHEVMAKDTRPNAPASVGGSVIWFGGR